MGRRRKENSDEEESESIALENLEVLSSTRPVPFNDIYRKRSRTEETCWGCVMRFGKQRQPGKYEALDSLWDIYMVNKDTMSHERLVEILRDKHETDIYIPSHENGIQCAEWPSHMISLHLKYHMNDPKVGIQQSFNDLCYVEYELLDKCFDEKLGDVQMNKESMKMYLDVVKQKMALYAHLK